jgi:hypothetical protein
VESAQVESAPAPTLSMPPAVAEGIAASSSFFV